MPKVGVVKTKVFVDNFRRSSETYTATFDICPAKWKIVAKSDQVDRYPAENAIDGNVHTMWHTPWGDAVKNHPHSIVVDLGETLSLKGFTYSPRGDHNKSGTAMRYNFYVSLDGVKFEKVMNNKMFNNIKNNPIKQFVKFGKAVKGKYFKFESLSEIDNKAWLSVGELGIITK
jgi:alpha-L-fucosidase